tara:strand:- start:9738 stop:11618 length:1881 start_codon:yes stop_codon:yes gene_type:complete
MSNYPKLILFILCLSFLSACGGGGGSSDDSQEAQEIEITPSSEFYEEGVSFSPSQVVFFQPSSPFEEGAVIKATDDSGSQIDVIGQADGSGLLVLPSNIEPGKYKLRIGTDSLSLNIDPISYPADSDLYVSNYIDNLKNSIETLIASQGVLADPILVQLLTDIQQQESNLSSLTEEEVSRIARLLYANADELFSNSVSIASSQFSYSAQFNEQECTSAKIGFVATVVATVAFTAVVSAEPTQTGKILFAGAFGYALYNLANETENVINKCPKAVISSLVRSLSAANFNTLSSRASIEYGTRKINYAKATATNATINFSDGVSRSFTVEFEEEPAADTLSIVSKFKALVNTAAAYMPEGFLPADLLVKVNSLGQAKFRDVTDEVEFEQVNQSNISCTGNAASYTCQFPNNGSTHTDLVDFQFDVTHAEFEVTVTKDATISPGNLPIIEAQTFSVIPGPGQVNRLEIQVVEDTNSPNYEQTKVLGFELVSAPTHGVILNEFNEFGILDYAADIIDDMPEQATLEVRVWNKYGYSEPAVITLNLICEFCGTWVNQDNTSWYEISTNSGSIRAWYYDAVVPECRAYSLQISGNKLTGDGVSTLSISDDVLTDRNDKNGVDIYSRTSQAGC